MVPGSLLQPFTHAPSENFVNLKMFTPLKLLDKGVGFITDPLGRLKLILLMKITVMKIVLMHEECITHLIHHQSGSF